MILVIHKSRIKFLKRSSLSLLQTILTYIVKDLFFLIIHRDYRGLSLIHISYFNIQFSNDCISTLMMSSAFKHFSVDFVPFLNILGGIC